MPPRARQEDLVQQLADRSVILEVVTRYATALDTKDWAALGSLFTEDATWEYAQGGELLSGRDTVVARIAATLQPLQVTQHLFGNHTVRLDGDEAEHTCYVQAQHVRLDGEKYLGAGRYNDHLRRTPDGWRFTHRRLTSVWSDGNPAVVLS